MCLAAACCGAFCMLGMGENATAPAITRPSIFQEEAWSSACHRRGINYDDAIVLAGDKIVAKGAAFITDATAATKARKLGSRWLTIRADSSYLDTVIQGVVEHCLLGKKVSACLFTRFDPQRTSVVVSRTRSTVHRQRLRTCSSSRSRCYI